MRLTVSGITYNFYPDIAWTADLGRFFKAPPGVCIEFALREP